MEAATYDVHNEGEAWTKLEHEPSIAEQPEEVYRYYGAGSNNTLNLWANPITGSDKLYASKFYAGIGSGHTLNFNGGGNNNLEVMAGRGLATPTASMKGSSGMAELGVKFKPDEKNPLTLDFSVQGWTGKQKGFGANLALQWSF